MSYETKEGEGWRCLKDVGTQLVRYCTTSMDQKQEQQQLCLRMLAVHVHYSYPQFSFSSCPVLFLMLKNVFVCALL